MQKSRIKSPKLYLSTILIEIGIICALVAVNTRPMSYGQGTFVSTTQPPAPGVIVKYTFIGDLDGDTDLGDDWNPRVANYGWPLKSVEIKSETSEVHFVDKKRLAANIASCLAIIVGSTIAIEWSIRYGKRLRVSRAIND